jgi:hypothetical protein
MVRDIAVRDGAVHPSRAGVTAPAPPALLCHLGALCSAENPPDADAGDAQPLANLNRVAECDGGDLGSA